MTHEKTPEVPEEYWQLMGNHLGYGAEELALFRSDPRNARVLAKGLEMRNRTIVFEVVQSVACNSSHVVGTRFYFTGDGNLISKWAPPRVCVYALPAMAQAIFGMQELWYAGHDPNELCFRRAGCFDVGVRCGGWGNIVVEARCIDREEAKALVEG